jgi:hypothetical protein
MHYVADDLKWRITGYCGGHTVTVRGRHGREVLVNGQERVFAGL